MVTKTNQLIEDNKSRLIGFILSQAEVQNIL